ncbi:MAG: hypothetical protein AB1445_15645 [Bacillota bacterium]
MRIREFLIATFALYQRPFNWLIDQWNFTRYHVLQLHTYYSVRYFGIPMRPHVTYRDELPLWEKTIGVWENAQGDVVGFVTSTDEEAGDAWIQVHPDYDGLYPEMLACIEANLADVAEETGFVKLYVNDGTALEELVRARGYRRLEHRYKRLACAIREPSRP